MRPIQFAGKDLNFMKIRIGNNIEVLIYKTSKMLIRTQEGCVICYLIYLIKSNYILKLDMKQFTIEERC
jgi:hypothetical protein